MTGIDGRVNNLNQDAFRAAQSAQYGAGTREKGLVEAIALKNGILKDGKIDANEQDLLNEILSGQSTVAIKSQSVSNSNPVELTFNNKWNATGLNVLRNISAPGTHNPTTNNADLNKAWTKGGEDFRELTQIYSRSPADAERVTNFLADKVSKAWDDSSITNGYGPLRSLIATGFAGVNQLEGDANVQGRWMVHNAIKQVDTKPDGSDGAIPNFLYNWIRPGGLL